MQLTRRSLDVRSWVLSCGLYLVLRWCGVAWWLIGIAPTQEWIIAARGLQGIGAAIVAPTSLSLITATFPAGPERIRAVAAYGTTAGLSASLGLLVGGALADWVSWRAGFFINVPIAVVMI